MPERDNYPEVVTQLESSDLAGADRRMADITYTRRVVKKRPGDYYWSRGHRQVVQRYQ